MPTPITPEMMARSGTEAGHQKAIILWAALNIKKYPDLKWLYHVPNGGSRNKAEAANLKAMGVKSGVPDLHLLVKRNGYSGLVIELKNDKGKLSNEQVEWLINLDRQGFKAAACKGWQEAVKMIEDYLNER